jgi:hypothetical protein
MGTTLSGGDPPFTATKSRTKFFGDLKVFQEAMEAVSLDGASEPISSAMTRRPQGTEYVRSRVGPDWTITMALYESKENLRSEYFAILPKMFDEMAVLGGMFYAQLHTATTRQGQTFIWPVKLPTSGASNSWLETAQEAVEASKMNWIRMFADVGRGHYRIMKAEGDLEEPEFLDKPFNELLEMAFKDRVIDSSDHPICRKLRGRI